MPHNLTTRTMTTRCGCCGRVKEAANHWRIIAVTFFRSDGHRTRACTIMLAEREDQIPDMKECPDIIDVCGSACELKLIEQLRNPAKEKE